MELPNNYELQKGKYRITGKIGQGGFGITYRALWQTVVSGSMGEMNTTVPVAIKEFFFEEYCSREAGKSDITITSATGRDLFEKFKNKLKKEAAILSKLRHPNIVRVLDVFEENNTAYIVMAFIEGRSLKEMIAKNGKLNEETTLKYAGQLCDALTEIHHHKILHLDIKPGNILIDKDDNVQLIDFGISKQYNDLHQETSTTPVGISKGFAPYEQYSGVQEFTPATDVYALGATLYYMLTAQVPTESICHIDEPLTPVRELSPQVSMPTERTIIKAMSMRRTDRQQAVSEFKNELAGDSGVVDERTVVEHKTPVAEKPEVEVAAVAAATPTAPPREEKERPDRSNRMAIIIGVVVTLFVVGFGLYSFIHQYKIEQEQKIAREAEQRRNGVLINGVRWATCNVASPGTFADSPESAGMYYQWNRRKAWNATEEEVGGWNSSEASGYEWEKANDPCPTGWRVPTHNELKLLYEVRSKWTKVNGIPGRQFGSGNNTIFLPASGYRDSYTGGFYAVGSDGYCWAAAAAGDNGYRLGFNNDAVYPSYASNRASGFPVRCIKGEKDRTTLEEKQKEKDYIAREEEKKKNGVLINGVRWATCNVASPGTFAARPESTGMFYQWNRRKAWNATEEEVGGWNSSEASGYEWEKANDPCPAGWRVPTVNEFVRLDEAGSTWTTLNGVNGRQFGSGSNTVFLSAAGYRYYGDGTLASVGDFGYYWAAAIPSGSTLAYYLYFFSTYVYPDNLNFRALGFPVRCVQE